MIMNIFDLQARLTELFKEIDSETISHEKASQLNATSGRLMQSISLQIKYAKSRNEKPNIEFMNKKRV